MCKKILKLVRNPGVLWIYGENEEDQYHDSTLIYGVTHVRRLTTDAYEICNKGEVKGIQFCVKEIKEEW